MKWNSITIVKTKKIGQQSTSFQSPNQPSNFRFPKTAFKAPGLGTIHGYIMTKRAIPHSAILRQPEQERKLEVCPKVGSSLHINRVFKLEESLASVPRASNI